MPVLESSGSSSQSVILDAPATAGTYYYGACVDPVPDESDTSDNCSSAKEMMVQPWPEVVRMSVSLANPALSPGDTVTLKVVLHNPSNAVSPIMNLRFYRSEEAPITRSDLELGEFRHFALGPGLVTTFRRYYTVPQELGTYYYGACLALEANQSDATANCSSAELTVAPQPDLAVGSPTVSDSRPETGASFALSATVSNTGDVESEATTLRYYRSTDTTISSSDTEVGTNAVPALEASASLALSVTLKAPAAGGAYYYGACVNAVADESDTTDNCSSSSAEVTVVEPQPQGAPEISIGALVSPSTVGPGQRFRLSATVFNWGDEESAPTTVRFYWSTDSTITTADNSLGTDEVGALASNGPGLEWTSRGLGVWLDAPSAPGTYYYGACVDPVEGESDTSNNCSTADELTVDARAPDLSVSAGVTHHGVVGPGERLTLTAEVQNHGGAYSQATTMRFYHSLDATIAQSDDEVGQQSGFFLQGGATVVTSLLIPAPSQLGTHYYGACVDPVPDESDTSNNCSTATSVTVEPWPDVVTMSVSLPNPVLSPGDTVTLEVVLHNPSDTVSPIMNLRYYRSDDATITRSDFELGEFRHFALGPGQTTTHRKNYTVPQELGTYYYGACLAPEANQSDPTTKCSSAKLTVASRLGLALYGLEPTYEFDAWRHGQALRASLVVWSQGGGASEAAKLESYPAASWTTTSPSMEATVDSGGSGLEWSPRLSRLPFSPLCESPSECHPWDCWQPPRRSGLHSILRWWWPSSSAFRNRLVPDARRQSG